MFLVFCTNTTFILLTNTRFANLYKYHQHSFNFLHKYFLNSCYKHLYKTPGHSQTCQYPLINPTHTFKQLPINLTNTLKTSPNTRINPAMLSNKPYPSPFSAGMLCVRAPSVVCPWSQLHSRPHIPAYCLTCAVKRSLSECVPYLLPSEARIIQRGGVLTTLIFQFEITLWLFNDNAVISELSAEISDSFLVVIPGF